MNYFSCLTPISKSYGSEIFSFFFMTDRNLCPLVCSMRTDAFAMYVCAVYLPNNLQMSGVRSSVSQTAS